jgi:ferredoxin-NADP reductase
MTRNFSEIAFTPMVRAFQTRMGSRENYAPLDEPGAERNALTGREAEFIAARDGFYQASVGENGWPYVQFRGGPAGFLKVLDPRTIGYADFRGNVQYISAGNIEGDGRVSLILMDYANRRRLKIWGRARLIDSRHDGAGWIDRLEVPSYRARIERAVVIDVEAYDWNCPQHITARFTEAEIAATSAPLHAEIARLRAQIEGQHGTGGGVAGMEAEPIGTGALPLVISGVRQLTPRIRAFELHAPDGGALPRVAAGAHLDVPVRLADGRVATRRYSITSDPMRRDCYEFAVLREDGGTGGSRAVHQTFALGIRLNCGLPGNDFELHADPRSALLIAGGIGITPIKSMAAALKADGRSFTLHYAARSAREMAYRVQLQLEYAGRVQTYASDCGERMDVRQVLQHAPSAAVIYVCGPARLVDAVRAMATELGIAPERVRFERFVAARRFDDRPVTLELRRSGRTIEVGATQSILEAVEAAGLTAPFSCRNGTCATCATKVLDGTPEHRDSALTDPERDRAGLMCICVSRAVTPRLALDL